MRRLSCKSVILVLSFGFGLACQCPQVRAEPLLRAVLIAAHEPADFSAWKQPQEAEPETFETLTEAYPGQTLYLSFVVGGYAVGRAGMADMAASYLVRNPLGQILYDEQEFSEFHGFVLYPREGYLVMEPLIVLPFDEEDPPGDYVIQGIVYDRTAGVTASCELTITLH